MFEEAKQVYGNSVCHAGVHSMYCFLDVRKEGNDMPVLPKSGFYPNCLDFYPDDLDLDFTHFFLFL